MSLFDTTGGRGIKFNLPGDNVTGTIAKAPYEKQQTVFGTDKLATYDNGDPRMQILVPLSTSMQEDANDDGDRTLYVASKNMKNAIAEAMRAAGASDIEVGGTLTVTFTGHDPASKNPANPAKLYSATYSKPSSVFAAPQPPTAAAPQGVPGQTAFPAAQQTQQQVAPPAHNQSSETVDKVKQLNALGIDTAGITAALGVPANEIDQILAF